MIGRGSNLIILESLLATLAPKGIFEAALPETKIVQMSYQNKSLATT